MGMNPDESSVYMTVRITEDWINAYLLRKAVVIPLRDQYSIGRLAVRIAGSGMQLTGEFLDVPDSYADVSTRIRWDAAAQRLSLDDLEVKTRTRNLVLKSAGWIAGKLMIGKIDQQVENTINDMLQAHLKALGLEPFEIPIPGQGKVHALLSYVRIMELALEEKALRVVASLEGTWQVELTGHGERPREEKET